MTQYVLLSPDTTKVATWFAGPQEGQDNYAEIEDTDARYLAYEVMHAAPAAYASAVAAGCQIVSTGTPSISGTYGIGSQDEINLNSLQAGIAASAPWLGGYRDIAGAKHTMTAPQFTAIATAILGYVEALDEWYAGGCVGSAPAQPVTIS
jgi:hypothetical protein